MLIFYLFFWFVMDCFLNTMDKWKSIFFIQSDDPFPRLSDWLAHFHILHLLFRKQQPLHHISLFHLGNKQHTFLL